MIMYFGVKRMFPFHQILAFYDGWRLEDSQRMLNKRLDIFVNVLTCEKLIKNEYVNAFANENQG
jgi:hypothetical protein